jgi:hypothetical protein
MKGIGEKKETALSSALGGRGYSGTAYIRRLQKRWSKRPA